MDKKEATKELAKLVKEAQDNREKSLEKAKKSLKKAKALADKHGLTFKWDGTYGNREQTYLGKGSTKLEYDSGDYKDVVLKEGEWTSSSDGC